MMHDLGEWKYSMSGRYNFALSSYEIPVFFSFLF